jgi:hypothetical protein
MSTGHLFTGNRIRGLLREVAEALGKDNPQETVVVVGGSLLAWHGLRSSTEDVDSSTHISEAVREAVRLVAARHQLATDWLNDHSSAWHPRTLQASDCETLLEHPRLRVLGAPLWSVFLMKLNRSGAQDVADMIAMWPLVARRFPNARAVTDAFFAAFPMESPDEFLGAHVADIARRAGMELPLT